MRITLLTFSSRHELLPCVARSITDAGHHEGVDLRWVVRMNPATPLLWNEHIKIWDETLRSLEKTWVLILSDDNLLHPSLVRSGHRLAVESPSAKVIHFRQQWQPSAFRPANLANLVGGSADGGQFLFDADYYNSFGFRYDEFGYEGHLFRKIHDHNPDAFLFHDETCTYNDRIRWL